MTRPASSVVGRDSVPALTHRGGALRVLLGPGTVSTDSGFLGTLELDPGEYVAEHLHPYSDEYLYVVAGRLRASLEDDEVDLGPGTALFVVRGRRHRLQNIGADPAEVVFHLCPLAPRSELGHVETEPAISRAEQLVLRETDADTEMETVR